MKKFLIAILIFFVLLIGVLFLVPIIFKDDIKAAIDKELEKSLNAKVFYDDQSLDISVFTNFPDISLSIEKFGIVGVDVFSNDTLLSVNKFAVGLDIMSVISGENIKVNSVLIDEPSALLLVMQDGKANYDIAKPREETPKTASTNGESAAVALQINKWEIINGDLIYFDQSLPFYTSVNTINHTGSGNFAEQVFDMVTKTQVESVSLGYDGVEYLSNKKITADVTMGMDFESNTYTFKDNLVTVNALPLTAEGSLSIKENADVDMDFTFKGTDLSIKSMLSLIPGVYNEYLDGLTASGTVNLSGYVRGIVNETKTPAVFAETTISQGKLQHSDYPAPLENIEVKAKFNYPTANLKDASFDMDKFSMLFEGEKTEARLKLSDFENFNWDAYINSHLDLGKITKVIHLEDGMELRGKIDGIVNSKGNLKAVETGNIAQIPTNGEVSVDNFYFKNQAITEPLNLKKVKMTFDPVAITLSNLEGNLGSSDFKAQGKIENHLNYIFNSEAVLRGNLTLTGKSLNLDELMTETSEEATGTTSTDTTTVAVVKIPKNIDFKLVSSIDKVLYDGLNITNLRGNIVVKDGKVILDNTFNLLKGNFGITGAYSTDDVDKPAFDFGLDIKNLSIPEAFKNFESIQKYAPIAKKVTGDFSTNFNVSGFLDKGMNPIYSELTGKGLVEIAEAALENLKSLQALTVVSKLGDSDGIVALKDVLMSVQLKEGRVFLDPFNIKVGSYQTNVSGSSGIDGSLAYNLKMDVPANSVTSTLTSSLNSFLGGKVPGLNSDLVLNIKVGGTYDNPKPSLAGVETKEGKTVQSAVKDQVKLKVDEKKAEIKKEASAVKDSLLNEGKAKADSVKKEVKEQTKGAVTKEVDKAKDKIKDLFKKKKKNNNDN